MKYRFQFILIASMLLMLFPKVGCVTGSGPTLRGKKNKDLWLQYHQLAKNLNIKIHWVRGHADNPFNNRCDQLATAAADEKNLKVDIGFEQEIARNSN